VVKEVSKIDFSKPKVKVQVNGQIGKENGGN